MECCTDVTPVRRAHTPRVTSRPVPQQLPPAIHGFVGRAEQLDELTRMLDAHLDRDSAGPGGAAVLAIVGPAGVGKTALVVHWAHQVRQRFPDGQLYVNLHGHGHERPMAPEQALDEFLRALGVPGERIPFGLGARADLFRSTLAGRRVLVLLDNAHLPEQVKPLLPDPPGCVAVVTSRSSLANLNAARAVPVGRLTPAEAVALLCGGIGAARADAEPDAVDELARLCDQLPLALLVAARRVAASPDVFLADLVKELTEVRARAAVMAAGEPETAGVRAVFVWSYRCLPAEASSVFRLIGLHCGPDISESAAAALTGRMPAQVRELMDVLVGGYLVEEIAPGRYRSHDLLRLYACEGAAEIPEPERAAAVERVLAWYLHTADAAVRAFSPLGLRVPIDAHGPDLAGQVLTFSDREQALKWCMAERANLVAATHHAAQCGHYVVAWKLAAVLWDFFSMHGHVTDWITTHEVGLAAARQLGDKVGEAWMENNLGNAYRGLGQFDEALRHFHNALANNEAIGNRRGEGWTRYNIGDTYRELGRFKEALSHLRRALNIGREIGERWSEGYTLNVIGDSYRCLGQFDEALRHLLPALVANRELGHRRGEGFTLTMIGDTYQDRGRFEYALNYYQMALKLRREIGDRRGEGVTLQSLGDNCFKLGQLKQAYAYYQQSLAIRHETGDRRGEARTLFGLGTVQAGMGKPDEARVSWQRALVTFEDLGDPQAAQVRSRLEELDA